MSENERVPMALYDDPCLFSAYTEMRDLDGRLNDVVETPALIGLMPALEGISAADIGCGIGDMCAWLLDQGAASIVGYDSSGRMLARALDRSPRSEKLRFEQVPIESIAFPPSGLDLIVSGLALHYIKDFNGLAHRIAQGLRPSGSFIFSIEHPVVTCSERIWCDCGDKRRAHWPVDAYLDEGERRVRWLGLDQVPRQHRTVSSYINALLDAGLIVRRVLEPGPDSDAIARWPRLADQRRRPPFLVIRADKPA